MGQKGKQIKKKIGTTKITVNIAVTKMNWQRMRNFQMSQWLTMPNKPLFTQTPVG